MRKNTPRREINIENLKQKRKKRFIAKRETHPLPKIKKIENKIIEKKQLIENHIFKINKIAQTTRNPKILKELRIILKSIEMNKSSSNISYKRPTSIDSIVIEKQREQEKLKGELNKHKINELNRDLQLKLNSLKLEAEQTSKKRNAFYSTITKAKDEIRKLSELRVQLKKYIKFLLSQKMKKSTPELISKFIAEYNIEDKNTINSLNNGGIRTQIYRINWGIKHRTQLIEETTQKYNNAQSELKKITREITEIETQIKEEYNKTYDTTTLEKKIHELAKEIEELKLTRQTMLIEKPKDIKPSEIKTALQLTVLENKLYSLIKKYNQD